MNEFSLSEALDVVDTFLVEAEAHYALGYLSAVVASLIATPTPERAGQAMDSIKRQIEQVRACPIRAATP